MRKPSKWLGVLASLPLSILAVRAITMEISDLQNPCVVWGSGNSGSFTSDARTLCVDRRFRSDSRTQASVTMAVVPGGILVAAFLGLWGTARARPKIALLAGFLMLLEGIPLLLSVGLLSFVAGGALVWSAWRELPQT